MVYLHIGNSIHLLKKHEIEKFSDQMMELENIFLTEVIQAMIEK